MWSPNYVVSRVTNNMKKEGTCRHYNSLRAIPVGEDNESLFESINSSMYHYAAIVQSAGRANARVLSDARREMKTLLDTATHTIAVLYIPKRENRVVEVWKEICYHRHIRQFWESIVRGEKELADAKIVHREYRKGSGDGEDKLKSSQEDLFATCKAFVELETAVLMWLHDMCSCDITLMEWTYCYGRLLLPYS